jgi:hypothetical protein
MLSIAGLDLEQASSPLAMDEPRIVVVELEALPGASGIGIASHEPRSIFLHDRNSQRARTAHGRRHVATWATHTPHGSRRMRAAQRLCHSAARAQPRLP